MFCPMPLARCHSSSLKSNPSTHKKARYRKHNRVCGRWLRRAFLMPNSTKPIGPVRHSGAETVSQAQTARQVLKQNISIGELGNYPPPIKIAPEAQETAQPAQPVESQAAALAEPYQTSERRILNGDRFNIPRLVRKPMATVIPGTSTRGTSTDSHARANGT